MKKLLLLGLLISQFAFAQNGRRLEVLFLGDNGHHRPIERVPFLMEALGPRGINFTYTDQLSDLNAENLQKYDALMLYANIDVITPEAEKALLDYVASGKGFLPIHCASYCFRNSEAFVKLVGGQFWRHTMDSIRTQTLQPEHPIMKGLEPFTAFDETYLHTKLAIDNNILADRLIKSDQEKDKPGVKTEPYTWTRVHGQGKIFYTAYGHDDRTWSQPGFHDLIYNAILWTVNQQAKAEFDKRNPKPFQYREAALPNYEKRPGKQLQQLPLSPEESMKHIQIPVDFDLQLFAAEPNVMHPIAMTWDEKGRLFVLITKDYPNERKPEGGSDYILMCEDTNADGKADKFTRFADGLSIPTGMVFANGGLIVTQAPDILFIQDTNGDDKADVKKQLYTGFGTHDTHAGPSNLKYGFDNWIWGCVGYSGYKGKVGVPDSLNFGNAFFRFKADGSALEWMTSTSNNTWGFAFNETNDVFGSTANNSHGWYMAIPNSYYNANSRINSGSKSMDTHKDMKTISPKVRQVDVFGGFTAASGHNFYTARSFPERYWNKIAFVTEPTGHIVHQNNILKTGSDYNDKEAFNLMAGADEWFSPVFAEVGPDGAVWVADWYSFIIQHNPRPDGFEMGTGNAYETDLRDYTHGRIYRVGYKKAPAYQPLSLSKNKPEDLLKALSNDNMFWRMQAQRLLVERAQNDVVSALINLLKSTQTDQIGIATGSIHALWTLQGLGQINDQIIEIGLNHPNADVRKNTLKAMPFTAASVAKILKKKLLDDQEPLVVLNSLLVMSKSPLNKSAEKAIINKLNSYTEVNDRWIPEAFACVLTANNGKLLNTLLKTQKGEKAAAVMAPMDHSKHQMNHDHAEMSKGVDLVVTAVNFDPLTPMVQERINVSVTIKNQGSVDLPAGSFIPFDIRFQGQGVLNEQVSRNNDQGLKAGESVDINANINGPWKGLISFSADVAGAYDVAVNIDKNNELKEDNRLNNMKTFKLNILPPPDMRSYVVERALRSQTIVSSASEVITMIKNVQGFSPQNKKAAYRAFAEGWDFRRRDVKLSAEELDYLKNLKDIGNPYLNRLAKVWGVFGETRNARQITIKAIPEAMKYDISQFTVKAGETIELIFVNPDAMQHNIVITKPSAMESVGAEADKMMMDNKAMEKNYVPEVPEVLFSSPLVNPDETYRLIFKAPAEKGDYPFMCTFPGHWRLMNGLMKVE